MHCLPSRITSYDIYITLGTRMIYAYIRVSSVDQSLDRQFEILKEINIAFDKIFTDKESDKDTVNCKGLQELLSIAQANDSIYICSMDRLARNLQDLLQVVQNLSNQSIKIHFIKEALAFTGNDNPMSTLCTNIWCSSSI